MVVSSGKHFKEKTETTKVQPRFLSKIREELLENSSMSRFLEDLKRHWAMGVTSYSPCVMQDTHCFQLREKLECPNFRSFYFRIQRTHTKCMKISRYMVYRICSNIRPGFYFLPGSGDPWATCFIDLMDNWPLPFIMFSIRLTATPTAVYSRPSVYWLESLAYPWLLNGTGIYSEPASIWANTVYLIVCNAFAL